jgi:hypothetical protein
VNFERKQKPKRGTLRGLLPLVPLVRRRPASRDSPLASLARSKLRGRRRLRAAVSRAGAGRYAPLLSGDRGSPAGPAGAVSPFALRVPRTGPDARIRDSLPTASLLVRLIPSRPGPAPPSRRGRRIEHVGEERMLVSLSCRRTRPFIPSTRATSSPGAPAWVRRLFRSGLGAGRRLGAGRERRRVSIGATEM